MIMDEIKVEPEDFKYLIAALDNGAGGVGGIDGLLSRVEELKLADRGQKTVSLFLGVAPTLSYQELEERVIQWSKDRMIIPNATTTSQTLKAVSEMGELADAISKNDLAATMDAIGDIVVCLINVCALLDVKLESCLDGAYSEIKDRKGTLLPSGVFVKE